MNKLRRSGFVHKLIIFIAFSLLTLALLSFWKSPAYEKGVWIGLLAFSNCLTGALSFMFGITIPGPGYPAAGGSSGTDEAPHVKCPKCGHEFDVREG